MFPYIVDAAVLACVLWRLYRRRRLQVIEEGEVEARPPSPSPAVSSSLASAPDGQDSSLSHDDHATGPVPPTEPLPSPPQPTRPTQAKEVEPAAAQTPSLGPLNSGSDHASQSEKVIKNPLAFLSIGAAFRVAGSSLSDTFHLDGGRWETLSPLSQIEILGNILSSYEFDNELEENSVRLGNIFDLIVGTGTGA